MADSTNIPQQSFDPSSSARTSMDVSPSTNSNSSCNYEVFINHHGKDVKKTLASHLYRRLCDHGFRVFLDLTEMRVGNSIDSQLEGAIATASVNVAIFSQRYAQSKWCLNELVQMNNRMQKGEASIIPIFYKVNPCDLRIRTDDGQHGLFGQILGFLGCSAGNNGVYAEALRRHVKKRRYSAQQIAKWKEALSEVSKTSGLELKTYNGDEGQLVEDVIQLVKEKVRKLPLCAPKVLIGLNEKLQDLEKTIVFQQQRHSEKAKVVGIVGSAGVGKTALAIEFFERNKTAYNKSYFLEDVRAESSLISSQKNLYRGLTLQDLRVGSIPEGRTELSRCLSGCKALIILDNVDDANQLYALFSPLKEVLSHESLILLTSRNWDLLNGVSSVYKLSGLDREQSQSLFCMHAFQEPQPRAEFDEVVTKFLEVCDGLPLSLEVYGSHLSRKDLKYWKGLLEKISALVLLPEIKNSLKISYDRLDDQEKEVFLDIACFLIEEDKDQAISVWDGSRWAGSVNLQNLEENCIVQIDSQNRIRMHNHLRDLGRTLAEEELPKYPRRLWRGNDNIFRDAVIQPRVRGINRVQGVSDQSFLNSRYRPPVDVSTLNLLRAEGDCLENISEFLREADQLLGLWWDKCPDTSLPAWLPTQNLIVRACSPR